jgi:tetraacyldisaccharide 4'-kinase
VVIGNEDVKIDLPKFKANFVAKKSLKGNKYIAFAGIGNPDKFFNTIIQAEGEIIKQIAFPDHYQYTDKDIENLIDLGEKLITTEKDYVRINPKYLDKIEVLPVDLVFDNEQTLKRLLLV